MSNVITINPETVLEITRVEETVQVLREALARAEAGETRSIGLVEMGAGKTFRTSLYVVREDGLAMLGAIELLKRDYAPE